MPNVSVTFRMKNGKLLECRYGYSYTPATYWDPAESDVGDPEYFIDNKPVEDFPKGLEAIAELMYEDSDNKLFDVSYDNGEPEPEPEDDY